jgi:hypothetical protein
MRAGTAIPRAGEADRARHRRLADPAGTAAHNDVRGRASQPNSSTCVENAVAISACAQNRW